MINLIFNYYETKNFARNKELKHCLEQNLNNPHIDFIHLFNESSYMPIKENVKNIPTSKRLSYRDYFDYIEENIKNEDDIFILTNSDCFFEHESFLYINNIKKEEAWCLSRWNVVSDGVPAVIKPFNRPDSQDATILRGFLKKINFLDFFMGVPGCDNRLAYELDSAGYVLKNPLTKIKLIHYHMDESRNYNGKVNPPYKLVPPF